MRATEIFLISLPFLLGFAWLLGLRHASFRAVMAAALALAALGVALVWFGQQRGFTGPYTPAKWKNGQIVREHGG